MALASSREASLGAVAGWPSLRRALLRLLVAAAPADAAVDFGDLPVSGPCAAWVAFTDRLYVIGGVHPQRGSVADVQTVDPHTGPGRLDVLTGAPDRAEPRGDAVRGPPPRVG